jgi:hypothetical protein
MGTSFGPYVSGGQGVNQIPLGARVTFTLSISGPIANPPAVVAIVLRGRNSGTYLAGTVGPNAVAGYFFMPSLDYIDLWVENGDTETQLMLMTWQAVTP